MTDVRIRHAYDKDHKRCVAPTGSRIADKMSVVFDDHGHRHLEKVGETDRYAFIQSFKESVDLKQIIERCALSGDMSMLQKVQGTYGDYIGMPGDLRSLENLRMTAEGVYDRLSAELKAKMSLSEFLESFTTQEKFDALQSVLNPSSANSVESEVVNNESKQ